MRLFVAVDLPSGIKEILGGFAAGLEQVSKDARFTDIQNLHITLKFLGETCESTVSNVEDTINGVLSGFSPFKVEVLGSGVFPSAQAPRVAWVGAESFGVLEAIFCKLGNRLESCGFKKDQRMFSPHVTIARIRSSKKETQLLKYIRENEKNMFGAFEVNRVDLMESRLTSRGAQYACLRTFDLVRTGGHV